MADSSPEFAKFLEVLRELAGDLDGEFIANPNPKYVIPAKCSAVGDVVIFDEAEELNEFTVEIGDKYHTHFSAYSYAHLPSQDRLTAAAKDAASYVFDVLADRVFFSVEYRDGKCIGASSGYVGEQAGPSGKIRFATDSLELSEPDRSESYLWSGRITAS